MCKINHEFGLRSEFDLFVDFCQPDLVDITESSALDTAAVYTANGAPPCQAIEKLQYLHKC